MATPAGVSPRAMPAVWFLALTWVVATVAIALRLWGLSWEAWAEDISEQGARSEELGHASAVTVLTLVGVAAGGAVLVAVVAFWGSMTRTGSIWLAIAAVIAVVTLPLTVGAYRVVRPDPTPAYRTPTCQEHSGGESTCPGG